MKIPSFVLSLLIASVANFLTLMFIGIGTGNILSAYYAVDSGSYFSTLVLFRVGVLVGEFLLMFILYARSHYARNRLHIIPKTYLLSILHLPEIVNIIVFLGFFNFLEFGTTLIVFGIITRPFMFDHVFLRLMYRINSFNRLLYYFVLYLIFLASELTIFLLIARRVILGAVQWGVVSFLDSQEKILMSAENASPPEHSRSVAQFFSGFYAAVTSGFDRLSAHARTRNVIDRITAFIRPVYDKFLSSLIDRILDFIQYSEIYSGFRRAAEQDLEEDAEFLKYIRLLHHQETEEQSRLDDQPRRTRLNQLDVYITKLAGTIYHKPDLLTSFQQKLAQSETIRTYAHVIRNKVRGIPVLGRMISSTFSFIKSLIPHPTEKIVHHTQDLFHTFSEQNGYYCEALVLYAMLHLCLVFDKLEGGEAGELLQEIEEYVNKHLSKMDKEYQKLYEKLGLNYGMELDEEFYHIQNIAAYIPEEIDTRGFELKRELYLAVIIVYLVRYLKTEQYSSLMHILEHLFYHQYDADIYKDIEFDVYPYRFLYFFRAEIQEHFSKFIEFFKGCNLAENYPEVLLYAHTLIRQMQRHSLLSQGKHLSLPEFSSSS